MSELRPYRELEQEVHDQLYNNILLLTSLYETTEEFHNVFRKDMFVKGNKAAFYEVVYYLLNVLDPRLTKEKLTMWPPYDIKRENKFRSELLKYINELNSIYEHADIPVLMASHLISPGGLKFTKFMLKLSHLVLYEHLSKEIFDVQFCPKLTSNVNMTKCKINTLKKRTSVIQEQTREMLNNFENFHCSCNEKAKKTTENLTTLNKQIRDAKLHQKNTEEEFVKNYPLYPSLERLKEKLTALKQDTERTAEIKRLFVECDKLILELNSADLILNYSNLKCSEDVTDTFKSKEELDLLDFFATLNSLLEKHALELPNPSETFIREIREKIREFHGQYEDLSKKYKIKYDDVQEILEEIKQRFSKVELKLKNENETLAVPFDN